ncbi:metal-dependent hydrolase, partial [Staphylococcus aureus]
LALFLHVFVDIFNSYGTQALRPITNKWIQLSLINTFDSIIFTVLRIGIVSLVIGLQPLAVFFPIIALLIIYYMIRFKMRAVIKLQALKAIHQEHYPVTVFVAPTIKSMQWRVAIPT